MAKRTANTDLNHDNWDQEEESEEAGTFATASEDVLKDRVIKKAKRRGITSGEGNGPSVFAGFGGFKSASTTAAPATTAFSFLSGDKNGTGSAATAKGSFSFTNPDKPGTDSSPKPAATGFTFGSTAAPGFPAAKKSDLNEPVKTGFTFGTFGSGSDAAKSTFSFGAKAAVEAPKTSSFGFGAASPAKPADPPADKPKAEEKSNDTSAAAAPSLMDLFKPKAGTWVCSVCDVSNGPDKNECAACTTPKPGAAPAPAAAKKWECPSCMVFNEADKNSCVCCETAKPGTTAAPKAASGFGAAAGSVTASGFKFGATTDSPSSGFKFGAAPPTTTANETTGTGFKFGASADKKESKPAAFQFGTAPASAETGFKIAPVAAKDGKEGKAETKEYSKEFLTQLKTLNNDVLEWVKTHVSRNPHIFLTPVFKDYEKHLADLKSKHNVDQTSSSATTPTPPSASPSPTSTPSIGFGTGAKPAESTFKLGNGSTTTAAFSFGSDKKEFTFGSSSTADSAKSGFSGATQTAAKSGFSFGSFGGSTTSTFGTFGSGSTFSAAAAKASEAKKDEEDGEEEESDEPPKVEVTPVEEKDSIYSVRCKLFYMKDKEFADKGLGMLHLKPVTDSKKTQLLVRAETSLGNILFNIMLNKQMNFLKRGNNIQFVCIPNPPIPGLADGPTTMLIKVKNAEMADELEKNLKERIEQE